MLLIRRAILEDAEGIHDAHMRSICELCTNEYTSEQIEAWGRRPFSPMWRTDFIPHDFVWVVEQNGKIEGLAHLRRVSPTQSHISSLYVTSKIVGQGFGKRLICAMEQKAKDEGINCITLESTFTSVRFYEKMGYCITGPTNSILVRGVPIPAIPMAKAISIRSA